MNLASDPRSETGTLPPTLTPEYWERVFAEEDPWDYSNSAYESWKFDQTLSLLPVRRFAQALELGCAEGHLTTRLAPCVARLTAIDISPTAIGRARERCRGLGNVEFQVLNIASAALPAKLDLILCSEVLFYLPREALDDVARNIAASLKRGGHLLLAHGNVIADDRTRTGFDWGHPFGAATIGKVFSAIEELEPLRELRTPLFTVQLLRRRSRAGQKTAEPEVEEIPLPPELVLTPEVEKTILWDGAVATRAEARARESATRVPILMYHSVADDGPAELAPYRISPGAFREQLRYLRHHGYYSTTVEEWGACIAAGRPLPGRPVILTFDDGYKDFIENAWPLLERADFTATLFVVTEKVGQSADWDPVVTEPLPLMSWQDLEALQGRGVEIGSHSASHADFSVIPAEAVMLEGRQARARLRENLGADAKIIAFPWGRADEAMRSVLAQCGYSFGLTTWGGHSTLADDPMHLPRIEIFGDDDIASFAGKLEVGGRPAAEAAGGAGVCVGFADADTASAASHRSSSPAVRAVRNLDRDPGLAEPRGDAPEAGPVRAFPSGPATAEIVGFDGASAPALERPVHPGFIRSLSARLDVLIGEFVKLQTQLLNSLDAPVHLQRRLTMLFGRPVTGKVSRIVEPGTEVAPGIVLSFAENAQVAVTIEPKADHTLSPEAYLNTVGLALRGVSEWLELQVAVDWSDLSLAEHFQFCLYAQPSRSIAGSALLRLPRKSGDPLDLSFASFELHSDERNVVLAGDLRLPDFIELDTSRKPILIVSFSGENELSVVLHYLNVYFA